MSLALAGVLATSPMAACGIDETNPADRDRRSWHDDCPYEDDRATKHIVALEFSASERADWLLTARLDTTWTAIAQTADCEAELLVVLLESGKLVVLYEGQLDSDLANETARDIEVPRVADQVLDEVAAALAPRLIGEPPDHSDPGAVFRLLDEQIARLPADVELLVTLLSDGITSTPEVELNRPITDEDVESLAGLVAPDVDLEGRVRIDWIGMGVTTDPTGPPAGWLDQLTLVWRSACNTRGVATCFISTTQKG